MAENLSVRALRETNLPLLLELQEDALRNIGDTSLLRRNTPEVLSAALDERNIALGVFDGEALAAVGIAVIPVPPETDLRADLKKFAVDKAMDFKLVIVRGEYRGRGLQRSLMWLSEKLACKRGFSYFCASVSPKNIYSARNIAAMGYVFDHSAPLYGGLERDIYVKRLEAGYFTAAIDRLCRRYEGSELPEPEIDTARFLCGGAELCTAGDAAEYRNPETNEVRTALIADGSAKSVLFRGRDGVWEIRDFAPRLGGFALERALLNTGKELPF